VVSADGTALLEPGVRLPDAAAQANAAELLAEGTDKTTYQLCVLGADGAVPLSETFPLSSQLRPFPAQ